MKPPVRDWQALLARYLTSTPGALSLHMLGKEQGVSGQAIAQGLWRAALDSGQLAAYQARSRPPRKAPAELPTAQTSRALLALYLAGESGTVTQASLATALAITQQVISGRLIRAAHATGQYDAYVARTQANALAGVIRRDRNGRHP